MSLTFQSFTSGTTLFATQVNSNWTAWVNALSDGTTTFNVGNYQCTTAVVSTVSLGSSSSDMYNLNAAFSTHAFGSNIGTTTYPFGNAYVDHNQSGGVFFPNADITVSSGATSIKFSGVLNLQNASMAGCSNIAASALTITNTLVVSGSGTIKGETVVVDYVNQFTISGSTPSFSAVHVAMFDGSLARVGHVFNVWSAPSTTGQVEWVVKKNGSNFATFSTLQGTSITDHVGYTSFTRGSYTFSKGDLLTVVATASVAGLFYVIGKVDMEMYHS